jgi:hypothetical protein
VSDVLSIGVVGECYWPKEPRIFTYRDVEILAYPAQRKFHASLHLDIGKYGLSFEQGLSFLSELASVVCWVDNAQMRLLFDNAIMTGFPIKMGKFGEFSATLDSVDRWEKPWIAIPDAKSKMALALYREGMVASRSHCSQYSLLSYYKVLEWLFPVSSVRTLEMKKLVAEMLVRDDHDGKEFLWNVSKLGWDKLNAEDIALKMYRECRGFVAHAKNAATIFNPDCGVQLTALHRMVNPMQVVARAAIEQEFPTLEWRWFE